MPTLWAGVDVGGTKIAAGLVDAATGQVLNQIRRPAGADRPPQAVVKDIRDLVATLAQNAASRGGIGGVGIALPELVDNEGRIESTWNFDVRGLAAALPSQERGGAPLVIDSDVRVAALAEARFGSGRGLASFVYVAIGTGMSCTLCIDGRPWRGANGFAIHFASSALLLPCARCGAASGAVVEAFASGRGLVDAWRQRGGAVLPDGAADLERLAAGGDAAAGEVLRTGARAAGSLLAQMVNMLDPEAVVLGGGLGRSSGLYRRELEAAMRDNIFAARCRTIPLLDAALGEWAGVIGAALAAQDGTTQAAQSA